MMIVILEEVMEHQNNRNFKESFELWCKKTLSYPNIWQIVTVNYGLCMKYSYNYQKHVNELTVCKLYDNIQLAQTPV